MSEDRGIIGAFRESVGDASARGVGGIAVARHSAVGPFEPAAHRVWYLSDRHPVIGAQ